MASIVDCYASSDDETPYTNMMSTPTSKQAKFRDINPMATPTNKRDLIPKSTAKPSTRRVRRLGGAVQMVDNPLFRPWNLQETESPFKASPRKSLLRTPQYDLSLSTRDTLNNDLKGTPELKIPMLCAPVSPLQEVAEPNSTELRDDTMNMTFNTERIADRLKRSFGGSRPLCSPSKKSMDRKFGLGPMSRFGDDYNVTGTIFEEPAETTKSRPSTAESSYTEPSEIKPINEDSWSDSELHISGIPEVSVALDSLVMKSRGVNGTNRVPSLKFPILKPPSISDRENTDIAPDESETENEDFGDDSIGAALAEQFANDCRIKTPPRTQPVSKQPAKTLQSPRKQVKLATAAQRQTVDDFWNQSTIDNINTEFSPQTPLRISSPIKSPTRSPSKLCKAEFEAGKQALAMSFLEELDQKITDGKVGALAQSTGGVSLIWSKTLNTTAGRANWKRESIKETHTDGSTETAYKHHSSIELAEKVIDSELKLLNVIAHEFCHLANFMITGITNNPHGKEFKVWAAKCTQTFSHRGIEVTTKHSYDIDFKYVWQCKECFAELKRHSKSIMPEKHRCGRCKGQLEQIKPVPRKTTSGPSEYQTFLKDQMKSIRAENPDLPQKDVMKIAASQWKNRSTAGSKEPTEVDEVDDILGQVGSLSLEATLVS